MECQEQEDKSRDSQGDSSSEPQSTSEVTNSSDNSSETNSSQPVNITNNITNNSTNPSSSSQGTNNSDTSSSSNVTTITTSTSTSSNATTTTTSSSTSNAVDELETVERLEKYSCSEIVFHRQVAARGLLETLHEVRQNETDLQRVGAVICRFAQDSEPSIRAELAEQLPQIACFCLNPLNGVPSSMSTITLPILEQFLADSNSQVRKITQNSLAFMLEQNIVDFNFVEERISPVLVRLMDITNMDDYRIEAVTTVSKIVRFLGKSVTEKVFLQHFSRLCSDVSFHVRRACASNFGEISTVIGRELTESVLLPQFKNLCEDGIWGVRKACADVFVPVSYVCSKQVRQTILAPLFVSFLCDQSKWVKIAAFQSLGPFISTFADPDKTGLYYTDGGVIVVDDSKDHESNSSGSTDSGCSTDSSNSNEDVMITDTPPNTTCSLPSYAHHSEVNSTAVHHETSSLDEACAKRFGLSKMDRIRGRIIGHAAGEVTVGGNSVTSTSISSLDLDALCRNICNKTFPSSSPESSSYNAFQFWRIPIPDLDPEITRLSIDPFPETVGVSEAKTVEEDSMNQEEEEEGVVICQEDKEEDDAVFVETSHAGQENNNIEENDTHADDHHQDVVDEEEDDGIQEEATSKETSETLPASELRQMEDDSSSCLDLHLSTNEVLHVLKQLGVNTASKSGLDTSPSSDTSTAETNQVSGEAKDVSQEKRTSFYPEPPPPQPTFQLTSSDSLTREASFYVFNRSASHDDEVRRIYLNSDMDDEAGRAVNSLCYQNRLASMKQETIPSDLLEHYLNMTSPVNYETVDHELSHHCAFAFPAVAMTLGRRYWPCLKTTYEALASDVQWKVRWTLASSLHQMALILGPEHTSQDLIPVFLNFMKDADEVRFGILQNLSSTLRLLNRPEQLAILPRITEFLKMENPRNWRFRYTLAEQVIGIAPLFSPTDIKQHLLPIAYTLLKDKVSEVRLGAIRLLSVLMRHFFCDTSLPPSTTTSSRHSSVGEQQEATTQVSTVTVLSQQQSVCSSSSNSMIISEQMRSVQGSVTTICLNGSNASLTNGMTTQLSNNNRVSSNNCVVSSSQRLPLDQVSLELISELTALIQSNKWVFRQSFVFLCEQMIADQSLPIQVFNDHFFACLLSLQNDRVNNVRLALSRCLTRSIYGNVMFHEKQPLVAAVLDHFRNDPDLDVRRFASNGCGQRTGKSVDGNPEDATMTDVSSDSNNPNETAIMQQQTTSS